MNVQTYIVVPASHSHRVGEEFTGPASCVVSHADATPSIARTEARYAALYGAGCPESRVVEVEVLEHLPRELARCRYRNLPGIVDGNLLRPS